MMQYSSKTNLKKATLFPVIAGAISTLIFKNYPELPTAIEIITGLPAGPLVSTGILSVLLYLRGFLKHKKKMF